MKVLKDIGQIVVGILAMLVVYAILGIPIYLFVRLFGGRILAIVFVVLTGLGILFMGVMALIMYWPNKSKPSTS